MRIDKHPPTPGRLFSGWLLVLRGWGCFALPFPYRVAVGAVCQIPASLCSVGSYPQAQAGNKKGKKKVKGGRMPGKPLSMRVYRGGGRRNITKARRNITKARRNITTGATQHHQKSPHMAGFSGSANNGG